MILIELALNLYTAVILGTTGIIEAVTGLYPREQLAYVQQIQDLPETTVFSDTISSVVMK